MQNLIDKQIKQINENFLPPYYWEILGYAQLDLIRGQSPSKRKRHKLLKNNYLLTKPVIALSIARASAVCVRNASQCRMAFDKLHMSEECFPSTWKRETRTLTLSLPERMLESFNVVETFESVDEIL